MTSIPKYFFFLLLFFFQFTNAQKTVAFKTGLSVSGVHHYGREALYADSLAFRLYNQSLEKPAAGKVFAQTGNGEPIVWTEVVADSTNTFRSRRFGGGGYLYLTYDSPVEENVLLNIMGNSAVFFNGVLHAGDPYGSGWLFIPVQLKKGLNELYVRTYFRTSAAIIFPEKPVMISTADSTMPYVVINQQQGVLQGAVVIINASSKAIQHSQLKATVSGEMIVTNLPEIPALSTRKIIFNFNAASITQAGKYDCSLQLTANSKAIDEKKILVEAVDASAKYSSTFISEIDGSLQYYAVAPQLNGTKDNSALFLSVHGAGVEAIGQARAYQSKDWGTLVAATNRRPRGFNWEDWGRLDALEVLTIAKEKFKPDPQKIYLTGHSMGGHGTWFLGATYPCNWAAIAPCSGYPTLKEYGSADGKVPDSSTNAFEQLLLRSGNQSDVLKLANNYKASGIYILHGDSDKVVSVNYARQMKNVLAKFHPDFSYYEYPGGEHWFGDQSVDWKPLFDFFKWHIRLADSAVNEIDFTTSSPGVSSTYRWVSVMQQLHPLAYSRIQLQRNLQTNAIKGSTENIQLLKLALNEFAPGTTVSIMLDSASNILYKVKGSKDSIYLHLQSGNWAITGKPESNQKGPERYGTFKEAFNHNMIFVYGTKGTKAENEWSLNKAKYDAESWYYRGNGAVDMVSDKAFLMMNTVGRGVVLYGNKSSNAAWENLLADCPIQVDRNRVTLGDKTWTGDDLAGYFTWPIKNSPVTSVAVISGSGLKGMRAADANQYFAGGSGFPDFMIFKLGMLVAGAKEIQLAGFFDNNWELKDTEFIQNK
ncbi:alpha/beta hydrolase [soil metagenome]